MPQPAPTQTALPLWVSQTQRGTVPPLTVYSATNWSVNGPVCSPGQCSIGYVVTLGHRSLSQHLSADVKVEGTGKWDYHTNPDNTCASPAAVSAYFQQAGDTGGEFGRWFGPNWNLAAGSGKIFGDLTKPETWVSVFGKPGNTTLASFQAARSNVGAVGIVFGGGCFAGHGAFVLPNTGNSKFTLDHWEAK